MCFKHAKENRVAPHQLCIPVLPRLFVFLGLRKSNAWDLSNARIADGWHQFPALLTLLPYFEETNKQPLRIPTVKSQNLSFCAQLCSVPFLWEDLDVPKSLSTLWMELVVPSLGFLQQDFMLVCW